MRTGARNRRIDIIGRGRFALATVAMAGALTAALLSPSARADDEPIPKPPPFTGPLLAPTASIVPPGHVLLEPYLFFSNKIGKYNNHWALITQRDVMSANIQLLMQFGVTDFFDIKIIPQTFMTFEKGQSAYNFGDLDVQLGFGLLKGKNATFRPDLKLVFAETFPTGNYQYLNPNKANADASGGGAFMSSIKLLTQWVAYLGRDHFLRTRVALTYGIARSAHVAGPNAFGTVEAVVVLQGTAINGIIAFEYNFTEHWVLALDNSFNYAWPTQFTPDSDPTGAKTTLTGTVTQFSLAPAFEYLFNEQLGVVAGVWFSVAGRNTNDFVTPTVAVNYYD